MKSNAEKSVPVRHDIPPVFDGRSTVLILGSFPSVASREEGFFYAHPQNRFWKVLSALFLSPLPCTVQEKKTLLLTHGVALFDVIRRCEISGSADSSVKNVIPNDLSPVLSAAHIRRIFVNGKTAEKYYVKYIFPKTLIPCVCLPSPSAANASYSLQRLTEAWKVIL